MEEMDVQQTTRRGFGLSRNSSQKGGLEDVHHRVQIASAVILTIVIVAAIAIISGVFDNETTRTEPGDHPPAKPVPEDLCQELGEKLMERLVPASGEADSFHHQWRDRGRSTCHLEAPGQVSSLTVELERFGASGKGSGPARAKSDFRQLCTTLKERYESYRSSPTQLSGFDQVCSLAGQATTASGAVASLQVLDGPTHIWIKYSTSSKDAAKAMAGAHSVAQALGT